MACIDFKFFIADCAMNGLVLNGVERSFMAHGIHVPQLLAL